MKVEDMIDYLMKNIELEAITSVERDHYGHYKIPDKEQQVERKINQMLIYIAEHAGRNC